MKGTKGASPEAIIRDIKRKTRREFTAEEKIRIVLEGMAPVESSPNGVSKIMMRSRNCGLGNQAENPKVPDGAHCLLPAWCPVWSKNRLSIVYPFYRFFIYRSIKQQ